MSSHSIFGLRWASAVWLVVVDGLIVLVVIVAFWIAIHAAGCVAVALLSAAGVITRSGAELGTVEGREQSATAGLPGDHLPAAQYQQGRDCLGPEPLRDLRRGERRLRPSAHRGLARGLASLDGRGAPAQPVAAGGGTPGGAGTGPERRRKNRLQSALNRDKIPTSRCRRDSRAGIHMLRQPTGGNPWPNAGLRALRAQ